MRRMLGVVLLGGALGLGLYSNAPSTSDREAQVAAVTRIVAQGSLSEPVAVAAEQPGLRQPIVNAAPVTGSTAGVPAYAAPQIAATAPPLSETTAPAWQTSVAPVAVVNTPPAASHDTGASARQVLARQIQAELKRAGCYAGPVNGNWTAGSRAAMEAFITRVNASLPTAEPDVILLTLAKAHGGSVCGLDCAAGEVARNGRCERRQVVASIERPAAAPVTTPAAAPATPPVSAPTAVVAPLPGRMSIGGPKPDVAAAPQTAPITSERLPWSEPAQPQLAAPRRKESVASTHLASLEPQPLPVRRDAAPVTATVKVAPPKRAAKPVRARPAAARPSPAQQRNVSRRRYATRSVQSLFLHPLGRM